MSKREIADYLQDILDAVAAIEQFTTGIEFEAFSQNLEKVFAVSRAIEIIGEAVNRCRNYLESSSGGRSSAKNYDF
ncbi:MAG: HepT-like ribonuclease domain-containing protein [Leptolyngbyaceae cyanobacterium bins.302]|nr:HepT-like ribonuclease domain-containing protein [Leptolyngbyaceae cyanobacterium bins.302]